MDARKRSIEDACKRRLQKSRVKDTEKHLDSPPLQLKGIRYNLQALKFVVAFLILLAIFLIILTSPYVLPNDSISGPVSRWIWGGGPDDPRYRSHLDIRWHEIADVLERLREDTIIQRVGLLNFNSNEIGQWKKIISYANHTVLQIHHIDSNVTWESLYPEWIDEEQENEVPSCPSLPKIKVPKQRLDLIAVKLPCINAKNWSRDVARLHLQLAAAGVATSVKGNPPVQLLFVTNCFPIPNLFTCKELVIHKGDVWLYKPNLNSLREKLQLPVGSCELALPLGNGGGKVEEGCTVKNQREAYATVLLSAHLYVCGAITAARSIRMAGSTKDLVILVDETISNYHRNGLEMAGWKVRTIKRIRNPKAERKAYNEWNYSKFRLWQLTDYDKIIFIDADLIVLRNIDLLFRMPEISAVGNSRVLFNSGVMVIEPSNCTFQLLMDHINEIESYNGGDQGYLNEIFTWWHRIPKHMNFLKHFWSGDDDEAKQKKIKLFEASPPVLYVLHYLGYKPWMCFRDYDCNWNVGKLQEFASDVAHRNWWKVHDSMPERLRNFCTIRSKQRAQLEYDRKQAKHGNYTDGHWRIKIMDPRKECTDKLCNVDWESKGLLWLWGNKLF